MSDKLNNTTAGSDLEIRIERLNPDKTRKDVGSDTVYHVYFELSGHPPTEWRKLFGREWQKLNLTQRAEIDGPFLVLHCQLHEVATALLPALKNVVTETNEAYRQYVRNEAAALQHQKDVWKQERQDVDDMGESLRFD